MYIKTGNEYECDLTVELGLFGKHDVRVVVAVDDETSFHGYGYLTGEPFEILGFKVDSSTRMVFDNGAIDGQRLSFEVSSGSLSASFAADVADDGTVTGSAQAGALLRARIKGKVVSEKPLS